VFATVYIHTHDKPCLDALVAQHSIQRNRRLADQLDVQILHTRDRGILRRRRGPQHLHRDDTALPARKVPPR
jgi:hypothetical protein